MLMILVVATSCGKDEPRGGSSGGGSGDTPAQGAVDVTVNVMLTLPDISAAKIAVLQADYLHRFVVELHNTARTVIGRTIVYSAIEDFTKATAEIPVSVVPGNYKVAVWSDYVRKTHPGNDLHYDTSTLIPVKFSSPYQSCTESKECFSGVKEVTVAPRTRAEANLSVDMQLHRPMGRVEFVTTDVARFRSENLKDIALGTEYQIRITYPQYIASGFNVHDDVMKELKESVSFTTVLDISSSGDRSVIAFDYLFAEAGGSVFPVVIELIRGGEVLTRSRADIPVRRGENTVVSGEFLTRTESGGVSIDTGYDGSVTIDLGTI